MSAFFSSLAFATPLALWGLLALPIIWWLLRFTPPRPKSVVFPPLRILLGLKNQQETPDKTPWWLLLLRLALAALLIFAVAHPALRQGSSQTAGSGPLLLVVDDGWAAAKDWPKRVDALQAILTEAQNAGRTVTLATTTETAQPRSLEPKSAADVLNGLRALQPQALMTNRPSLLKQLAGIKADQVIWLADGLDAASSNDFAAGLQTQFGKNLTVLSLPPGIALTALSRPTIEGGDIKVTALQSSDINNKAIVQATAGDGRILSEAPIEFTNGNVATVKLSLPVELRNEIQLISIANQNHAGAKQILDDRWRRKTIAIQSSGALEQAQPLLSPLHYVTRALEPYGEIQESTNSAELKTALEAGLSMLVLADIGKINSEAHDAIVPWLEKGGVLLRFAGPHLATSNDDLMPVKLREGDRNLGSALSWETPQSVQSFADKSPFAGMKPDPHIAISRQVLAEPDADLPDKTWVSLSDGTPLVTATHKGKGLIILFHITANADWSNLPLSGNFVDMLQRIVDLSPAAGSNTSANIKDISNDSFALRLMLSGLGDLVTPQENDRSVSQNDIDKALPTVQTPAGIYTRSGQERAINLDLKEADLKPIGTLPNRLALQTITPPKTFDLTSYFFIAASLVFLLDCQAALLLGGALGGWRTKTASAAILVVLSLGIIANSNINPAKADDFSNQQAATETHLAFVKTGDGEIDQTSEQGLKGLGAVIADRTSAALGTPVGVNIETDELVFYPLLYWPVTETAVEPSEKTLSRLDAYMKNGGTILFDLRDAGTEFGGGSPNSEALKRILAKLDIASLEPVPADHALTKSFYLLKTWPGRYDSGTLWVEATNGDSPAKSDGVSGIIIGSNDYAAAWAIDDQGNALNALIPGSDSQREYAFRVGVNMVMYALTGNYKTDQVHVPALLERLGQ